MAGKKAYTIPTLVVVMTVAAICWMCGINDMVAGHNAAHDSETQVQHHHSGSVEAQKSVSELVADDHARGEALADDWAAIEDAAEEM